MRVLCISESSLWKVEPEGTKAWRPTLRALCWAEKNWPRKGAGKAGPPAGGQSAERDSGEERDRRQRLARYRLRRADNAVRRVQPAVDQMDQSVPQAAASRLVDVAKPTGVCRPSRQTSGRRRRARQRSCRSGSLRERGARCASRRGGDGDEDRQGDDSRPGRFMRRTLRGCRVGSEPRGGTPKDMIPGAGPPAAGADKFHVKSVMISMTNNLPGGQ